jgi:IS30 family transposase
MDGIVDLHHETIYQYILADKQSGGDLYTHLRHQNKTYRSNMVQPVIVVAFRTEQILTNAQWPLITVRELEIGKLIR